MEKSLKQDLLALIGTMNKMADLLPKLANPALQVQDLLEACECFKDNLKSENTPKTSELLLAIEKSLKENKVDVLELVKNFGFAFDSETANFSEADVLAAIEKAEVVSFDIFDTLLVRPYVKPTDLFYHIEKSQGADGFVQNRINAENNARRIEWEKGREDILYDNIYEQIDKKYIHLKEKELQMERDTLRVNPEIKKYFDFAKNKKKRIIIVSDMYLPLSFLEEVLHKNGIIGYEKFYLSSECKKTKSSSNLYRHIISELKINPQNIFHIGDNELSDYEIALKLGLKAYLYVPIIKQFFAIKKNFWNFYSKNYNSIGASILAAVWSYHWKICELGILLPNYWEKQGYYAGAVSFAFTKFIIAAAKQHNIDKVLFLARDGFLLQKIFDVLKGGIANDYVYAPRVAEWKCFLFGDDYSCFNEKLVVQIIEDYKNESDELAKICIEDLTYKTAPLEFIDKYRDLLVKLSEVQKNKFRNYFEQKCGDNTLVVDTLSNFFTSQRFIENLINKKTIGAYLYTNGESPLYDKNRMVSWGNKPLEYWDFWEFMMTSPEPPICDINQEQKPIYKENIPIFEKFRNIAFNSVEKGAIDFTKDIISLFGEDDIFADFELIHSLSENFIGIADEQDIENLSCLFHTRQHITNEYAPLFPQIMQGKTLQNVLQMIEENIKHLEPLEDRETNGFDYSYNYRHWHDSSQESRLRDIQGAYSLFEYHNLFPISYDSKVLEVGCGMGRYLAMLKQCGFSDLTGIDRDFSQTQTAKQEEGLKIFMRDANEFLSSDSYEKKYDCIYMFDVLEHIDKNKQLPLLKNLSRHLSYNGMLVLQVPNALAPLSMCYRYLDWTHEISFTDNSIEFLLHNAGLHYIAVRPQGVDSEATKKLKKAWADLYLAEIGKVPILTLNIVAIAFKNREAFMFWHNKLPYSPETYYGINVK